MKQHQQIGPKVGGGRKQQQRIHNLLIYSHNFSFLFKEKSLIKTLQHIPQPNTKAADEILYIDLFYINQCLLKFLFKLKYCVSD